MKQYLCDTNVISELMRRKPFASVASWLVKQDHIFLSVITLEEIVFGLRRKGLTSKEAWFAKFIDNNCTVLEVDHAIANRAGDLRGSLAAIGITRSQADMLIASTAWKHDLIVVTRNTSDFENTSVPVLNPFQPGT